MSDWNDRAVAEFRSKGGHVERFGRSLVLLHSTGAKSGEERLNPVLAIPDGDGWLIIASAAGAPRHPAWSHNLVAHPDARIELPAEGGAPIRTIAVRATPLDGEAWQEAWQRFLDRSSGFARYRERSGDRDFPIFRLTPRT
jgi:deazaflavin-dependent oxidoreductase (nitroreductase family)